MKQWTQRLPIIVLLLASVQALGSDCPGLTPKKPATPPSLRPFIETILNNSSLDADAKLVRLSALVGVQIRARHRWYPAGSTRTKGNDRVKGTIASIQKTETPGVFVLDLTAEDGSSQLFRFSATISPSFPLIDSTSELSPDLAAAAAQSAQGFKPSFDTLAIGLDTPSVTAAYKAKLRREGVIAFYGSRSPFYEFANFWEKAPLLLEHKIWPSSEHFYQAKKFEGAPDEEQVRKTKTPADSAAMGRDRTRPLRADWETHIKDDKMMLALIAKFTQYPDLYDVLMSTGDAHLVEHTERDSYWGDNEDGTGKAMLGTQLVQLRTALRADRIPFQTKTLTELAALALRDIETQFAKDPENPTLKLARAVAQSSNPSYLRYQKLLLLSQLSTLAAKFKSDTEFNAEMTGFLKSAFDREFGSAVLNLLAKAHAV